MPAAIRKSLLQFIFSGAYMKRWNDKLRPTELIEIDKQAHKMIVAWMLCRLSTRGESLERRQTLEEEVAEKGIFDYLFRLVITDIKPPVLDRIRENPDHYRRLAAWAMNEIQPILRPLGEDFFERFADYVQRPQLQGQAADILTAAHTFASAWELRLLKSLNDPFDEEIQEIGEQLIQRLDSCVQTPGVAEIAAVFKEGAGSGAGSEDTKGRALARFVVLCGQLRFQKRWSQTPRIPETSVMGHMFITACYAFFLSLSIGACPARRVNNFFSGLFHDLPEILTRDIISPVKKSFAGLGEIIRAYEESELERQILNPLLADGHTDIVQRLSYYLGLNVGSEFTDCIIRDGKIEQVTFADLQGPCNLDTLDPKDGEALKICDILAAYIEAYTTMRNGVTSAQIQEAFWRMREQNSRRTLGDFHIGAIFADFD
ncbi:MAG: HD domain-containing protein [Desulfovibrio sp.]|jgi:putative hydrolase of HD superfamily|nr:HD domain-containing protein [Desulfovibrio sp.]